MTSYSTLTEIGRNKEALSLAQGTPLEITAIAWGDGDYAPTGGEIALVNELDRKAVENKGLVAGKPNVAFFEVFLGFNDGPYVIREVGLFDADGDLIAIGKTEQVKTTSNTIDLAIEILFSDLENLVLQFDVSKMIAPADRRIGTAAGSGLKGGGDLFEDRELSADFATQAEAEAGTSETKVMSPKRVVDWLKKVVGLDDLTNFYHSEKPNPALRMGSASAGNFDGVTYDEATNVFTFKADVEETGTDPGKATIRAKKLRLTSTSDVAEGSTEHPIQIGEEEGAGVYLKFDANEISGRDQNKEYNVFWSRILQTTDVKQDSWSTTDGDDAWIVGENFAGDTGVSLKGAYCNMIRLDHMCSLSGYLVIEGFSMELPTDSTWVFYFNLIALARQEGWFQDIIGGGKYMNAWAQFHAPDIADFSNQTPYCQVHDKNAGSYPNHIAVSAVETDVHQGGATAERLTLRFNGMIAVQD